MEELINDLSNRIHDGVAETLRDVWSSRLSDEERELVRAVCEDAAELQIRALAAPPTPDAQLALLREKAHLTAQLSNLSACATGRAAAALWEVVRALVSNGVAIAFAAV